MKHWKVIALIALGALLTVGLGTPWAQQATRVVLLYGTALVSGSNPLPVTLSGGSGGAVTIADGADVAEGAVADAAATQGGTGTVSAKLRLMTSQLNTLASAAASAYPVGATPYTATATGTTGATTATLAGASSVTTYLCGFSIRVNADAAVTGNATVTGLITATLNFTQWTAPKASGLGLNEMIFHPCLPASGTNQSVAVVSAAAGTGGVVSVTAWGYKL